MICWIRKVSIAHEASRERQVAVAYSVYKSITHLLSNPGTIGWLYFQFIQSGDEVLQISFFDTLTEQCQQGWILSKLWLAESSTASEAYSACQDVLTCVATYVGPGGSALGKAWCESVWGLRIIAAANVGLGRYESARQSTLSACKLEPNNASHRSALKLCEQLQTTGSIDKLSSFKQFMTLIPAALKWEQISQVSVLAGADQERYALRAYGYIGPFHMETIVQKAGCSLDSDGKETPVSFDAIRFHEHIALDIAKYAQYAEKGVRPPDIHIGPGNETGAKGAMFAFSALHLDRLPHAMSHTDPEDPSAPEDQMLHLIDIMNVYELWPEELEREYPEIYAAFAQFQAQLRDRQVAGR